MRKIQTSINLTPEIKSIVDTEGLNLSAFVEDQLTKYFSVSTVNDINRQINELKASIHALEGRREDLLAQGAAESDDEAQVGDVLKELQENYKKRHETGIDMGDEHVWITSPKNLKRLKKLGKEPEAFLKELEKWYHGLQKD